MPVILISNMVDKQPLEIIQSVIPQGFDVLFLSEGTREELLDKVPWADYILASGRLTIDAGVIENARKLKMIQRTGVGLDSIDIRKLQEKRIPLYVNKGVNSDSVAEHTVLLILAMLKRLVDINKELKDGIWVKQANGIKNREIKGRDVGLVGLGSIGRKCAQILRVFGANIYYYDINRLSVDEEKAMGLRYLPFNSLVSSMDIISLHCALTEETTHLFSAEEFLAMKDTAFIINTARGKLIDEKALYAALVAGTISGAGLDVFEQEPLNSGNVLLKLDNVLVTPHIGGITRDSYTSMIREAMNNISLFEQGRLEEIEEHRWKI